jgi:hypothetical protein
MAAVKPSDEPLRKGETRKVQPSPLQPPPQCATLSLCSDADPKLIRLGPRNVVVDHKQLMAAPVNRYLRS